MKPGRPVNSHQSSGQLLSWIIRVVFQSLQHVFLVHLLLISLLISPPVSSLVEGNASFLWTIVISRSPGRLFSRSPLSSSVSPSCVDPNSLPLPPLGNRARSPLPYFTLQHTVLTPKIKYRRWHAPKNRRITHKMKKRWTHPKQLFHRLRKTTTALSLRLPHHPEGRIMEMRTKIHPLDFAVKNLVKRTIGHLLLLPR